MPLFCDNQTKLQRLYGTQSVTPYPKDGINGTAGSQDRALIPPAHRPSQLAATSDPTIAPAEVPATRRNW
jgi:hypothetical protein